MFNIGGCIQTRHIPTKKELEGWTQCSLLLSFLGGYFSSFKKILRQREICKTSWNHEKSWEITTRIRTVIRIRTCRKVFVLEFNLTQSICIRIQLDPTYSYSNSTWPKVFVFEFNLTQSIRIRIQLDLDPKYSYSNSTWPKVFVFEFKFFIYPGADGDWQNRDSRQRGKMQTI